MAHPPATSGTATCTRCERTLPVICFRPDSRKVNGLRSACRECDAEMGARTPANRARSERGHQARVAHQDTMFKRAELPPEKTNHRSERGADGRVRKKER